MIIIYLFADFNFSDVIVDNVKFDGGRDANDGRSKVLRRATHRRRHSRLADQVTSSFRDPVLRHRRK